MISMLIRDNVVWLKDLSGDTLLHAAADRLEQNAPMTLLIEGRPVLFRKMRDGKDGRRTPGLRPDESFKDYWLGLQERRGESVRVGLPSTERVVDPYLASLASFFEEWSSPEDAAAFDDL